ncbi:rhamnogalacturonan lyase [Sphaerisporangium sp. TRM90804]|uniref:rhamnogalacturonan lyase n=1 Tax=Sphaerisporangium sp. TRM90804 TaxID=3031113 RepID=UPI00244BF3F1|nr:rhamnogalacturonan lyase [Sphaerisporangium sp. TRM90804]MDH2423997.1 rhamnogalacturonan lyase [Sphaerisporangium sp. TRM90804]
MSPPSSIRRILLTASAALLCAGLPAGPARAGDAASGHGRPGGGVQVEHLDRGLVAASTGQGVFLSWRLLGDEVTGAGATGMTGADFRVYRDGRPIATVTGSTNHLDTAGTGASEYRVAAIIRGREGPRGAAAKPWPAPFHDLPLRRPADGVTPAGEAYTYAANDMSVGDVDGDGRYEYVVKWDPSNSKDVSQRGYTGPTYVDTYRFDGALLWRLDLGVNIRSGAHYTQFLVYDFDGDGRSEMMLKTAPGTKIIRYDADGDVVSERHITMPRQDVRAGYSHADDYRASAAGYFDHLVEMFLRWHEHPEVVAGRWPATLEQAFGIEPAHDYPLTREAAVELATHFVDVYAPARSANNRLREFAGFVFTGPEYLSVFNGADGRELQTIHYKPARGDDGLLWGDYAMARVEPANRVDRFLSAVAYLDGRRPSAIFARGYYTRTTLVAYDWNGRRLTEVWSVDSGHVPMSNPFNAAPHGVDGTDPEFGSITTQGFHSLSVADVDRDGRHEVIYGAATIDDDGGLLYSSFAEGPPQSNVPGQRVRLGHGDALHVGDFDLAREGLEIWSVHEGGAWAPYGWAMRDAATGEVLFGGYSGVDTGRGMVGDIDPAVPGAEAWSSMPPNQAVEAGLWSADGDYLGRNAPGTNMSIRWAADMTTQIVNGTATTVPQTPTIDDRRRGTLLTAEGTLANNGTKGNPALVADVFGDWREELLLRTADSTAIRMYLSTELTDRKLHTLMHDPRYRAEVARQQTAYNQPSYPSFPLTSDLDWSKVPLPHLRIPRR